MAWKWRDGVEPGCLRNGVTQYGVPAVARQEFDAELRAWIDNGWLEPYDESVDGPPRGLIPLMAVEQQNKTKVRPVLDCRELNSHVEAHTADADVCADTLRRWRRHGANVAVVDLKRAYLQLRTDRRLWPFQTVVVDGRRYALTRVGFGLNVAPLIMKAVVRTVLEQDPVMQRAVIPYVDDLCVNEDVVSAERVIAHFASYGLQCKPPERAADGARLLGLRVEPAGGGLAWRRDNPVGQPPAAVTRRSVFSWCGRVVAHLPVCGWLRPATAWLKRRVNSLTRGWDDVTHDTALREQLRQVADRLAREDPARGQWCVTGDRAVVWTDASSIAAGVVLESEGGDVIEDACWLRRDEATHINMAELDAAVRGINLALAWDMKTIELKTDSATVHRWVSDALSGRARLRTKAHGEMLIRRRVDVIRQLVAELGVTLSVSLVRSSQNRSDTLTRVPSEWVRQDGQPANDQLTNERAVAAVAVDRPDAGGGVDAADLRAAIADVHIRAGHPGVRRTVYFARRDVSSSIPRKVIREVVAACDVCRAIDPAPVTWRQGSLAVEGTWDRLAIDVTHHGGQSYLSVIDCGPSRFCVWRLLRRSDAASVTSELEQVFAERGAPAELLADNDTAFRSRHFAAFAARWGVLLRFRAVHRPSGNSIVERNHRSVKVIAARKGCDIREAVHLYNVTPRDGGTAAEAPANGIYRYTVRDAVRQRATAGASEEAVVRRPPARREGDFRVGDAVWVRRPGTRCTERSVRGTVSGVVSPQVVEVDGVPWHVRDLRHCGDTGGPAARPRAPDRGGGGPRGAEEDRAGSPVVVRFDREGEGAAGRPMEGADGDVIESAGGECGRAEGDSGEGVVRRGRRDRRPPDFFGHVVPIDALGSSSESDLEDQGGV